jgi:hypothetical protein
VLEVRWSSSPAKLVLAKRISIAWVSSHPRPNPQGGPPVGRCHSTAAGSRTGSSGAA